MKKFKLILSTPLIFFSLFKKSKWDNFVGGLIFGAFFSLLVNVITIHVQETVQRQRVLEALEMEILSHGMLANNVITENNRKIENNEAPSLFHNSKKYSMQVWTTSESLKYLIEVDPKIQGIITSYYSAVVEGANGMVNTSRNFTEGKLANCYLNNILTTKEKAECERWYKEQLSTEILAADFIYDYVTDVLTEFHPTRDRLNNGFLKLLMGDKAVGALSIQPINQNKIIN